MGWQIFLSTVTYCPQVYQTCFSGSKQQFARLMATTHVGTRHSRRVCLQSRLSPDVNKSLCGTTHQGGDHRSDHVQQWCEAKRAKSASTIHQGHT
jgi:hypothetical protein